MFLICLLGSGLKDIEVYRTDSGRTPFTERLLLYDETIKAHIRKYIIRVAGGGSKGNIRNLGDGIYEIKISKASGYRVYFGEAGNVMILLLLLGDKGSQKQDILKAKKYWRNHNV